MPVDVYAPKSGLMLLASSMSSLETTGSRNEPPWPESVEGSVSAPAVGVPNPTTVRTAVRATVTMADRQPEDRVCLTR